MSASAVTAMRRAICAALAAEAGLGAPVYDGVPRHACPPYVAFGDANTRDVSTSDGRMLEQTNALDVWSGQPGAGEALALAAQAERVLTGAALAPADHRLVNFAFVSLETRREDDGRLQRATLRFRAVTEAL